MNDVVPVTKSDDEEPVPSSWRGTFCEIVESFRRRDFSIRNGIEGVVSLSDQDADLIEKSISSFGADLASLPEEAWDTAVCRWTGMHWDVLVDMFTVSEGLSDLVMFSKVHESDGSYIFKVESVHVP